MKYLICSIIFFGSFFTTSIYSYTVQSIDGSTINFEDFHGKKIMLVNIATGSPKASQLRELQQLQEQYSDSLVIVGFPSDSFDKEAGSNREIERSCREFYQVDFLLAAKAQVKGEYIQPIYQWLTSSSQNGQIDSEVKADFQKYIISSSGELIGVFSSATSPLSEQIISVITGSSN